MYVLSLNQTELILVQVKKDKSTLNTTILVKLLRWRLEDVLHEKDQELNH